MEKIKRFFKEEEGLEMSEYALMGALICLGVALVVGTLSTAIQNALTAIADTITGAIPS
jgi:Flp pilus assembly pilin Flp